MSHQVIDMVCPGCGAPVTTNDTICEYCFHPIIISTFHSIYDMSTSEVNKYASTYRKVLESNPNNAILNYSIGLCYLKLKLYDKANKAFEKAIEENLDNAEAYFYAAISLLKGKRAFLAKRSEIDKIEEYIQAALFIELKGIYHYFLAYIKYDHFSRKNYKTSPTYQEALCMAKKAGVSSYDIEQFYSILGVERPSNL